MYLDRRLHIQRFNEAISNDVFSEWYRNRQAPTVSARELYKSQNAPKEDLPPDKIFRASIRIEESPRLTSEIITSGFIRDS